MTPAASASSCCAVLNRNGSLLARAAALAAPGIRGSVAGASMRGAESETMFSKVLDASSRFVKNPDNPNRLFSVAETDACSY